jgi:hypothetical protein
MTPEAFTGDGSFLTDSTIWQRTDGFVSAPVGEGTVILHLESGRYYSFDDSALAVWDLLEVPQSLAGLVDRLTATYDVRPETCESDTAKFLSELAVKGLIHPVK